MKLCAVCGASLPESSRFCPTCGVGLGLSCPSCGAENNPLAIRCGRCAASLRSELPSPATPVRTPRESRRIVTVLFADIVGYTSMVETHDQQTEALRALLQEWFRALSQDVLDHGGIVEKFIGDAICSLFGAPAVHEDDPERALRCALAMLRTVERLNQERRHEGQESDEIRLRIGIATGEVVGGTADHAGQEQYSVTGDAVNTASRLQSAAQPGQVLVSSATEQLTRDRFVFESAGTLSLKGKRKGVPAFLLLEERRETDRSGPQLVGRRRELEHLSYCLSLAVEGDCQLIEITGDAGVGKSRLVEAFAEESFDRHASVLVARGDCPPSMAGPLHPFVPISRSLIASVADDTVSYEATQTVAVLGDVASGAAAVGDNSPEEVAAALQRVIRARSERGSVILIIENVHRADADSLEVLQRLIPRLNNERLLLLWTRRSGEELVVQGDSLAEYTRISLRPLNDEDSERLMRQLLDGLAIPKTLEQRVVERSGGNPFYIEAMVRTIRDEGYGADGQELSGLDVPTTVQGLVQARLDSLPDAERLAAQQAAVAGRDFDAKLLQHVDLFGIEIVPALDSLARRGLIDHVGGSNYRFRHVLTQEVCYDTMLQALRTELHREIADSVADVYPERVLELAPYRADHYAKAGDTDRAVDILVEAGVSEA